MMTKADVHYCTDKVEISRLSERSSDEAFSLACNVFVDASVLHTAVGVTHAEYREYMRTSYEVMWRQGLSLVATDIQTGEIIGCLIACDYATQEQYTGNVPAKLKPVNALLKNLDNIYRENRQPEPGQCLLVDMAVVKPTASRRGIYRKLRERAHQVGLESGYTRVVGELSSAATQHLCVNQFNHKVRAEIQYAAFTYQGRQPFALIKDPASIMLVEGSLLCPDKYEYQN